MSSESEESMISKKNGFNVNRNWHLPDARKYIFALVGLSVLLLVIYGNSFHAEWHFDDIGNIVENEKIRIGNLTWSELAKSIYTRDGKLSRPVAYISFATNYYFGGLDEFGYHVTNVIIHFVAAFFLFLFIMNTLKLPMLRPHYGDNAYNIALLAAFFWAAHPIHVHAVTTIIQRMASLAGMFYIMAMYFYLKGRTSDRKLPGILFYCLCAGSVMLALGSKENVILLPLSILLYDVMLIQGLQNRVSKKNILTAAALLLAITVVIISGVDFSGLFEGYRLRRFSMAERLLTEPRVMVFYLSLLIYPQISRMALVHDIDISRSLLDPPSTALAILFVLFAIAYAIGSARKRPLLSYCIIFFFLNHIVEGSIIPLELIYEHRNYIPSMLFFVPIVIFLLNVLDYFSRRKWIQAMAVCAVIVLLADFGHTTYLRNGHMRYAKILWMVNAETYPNLSRPHGALAKVYREEGNYQMALEESQRALELGSFANLSEPVIYLCNIGNYYLEYEKDFDRAFSYYREAEKKYGTIPDLYNGMALAKLNQGNLQEARKYIQLALDENPRSSVYLINDGLISLKEGNTGGAITAALKILSMNENDTSAMALAAEVHRQRKNDHLSVFFWQKALARDPKRLDAHLALIELYDRTGQRELLIKTTCHLFTLTNRQQLKNLIRDSRREKYMHAYIPDEGVIFPIINRVFRSLASGH